MQMRITSKPPHVRTLEPLDVDRFRAISESVTAQLSAGKAPRDVEIPNAKFLGTWKEYLRDDPACPPIHVALFEVAVPW